MAAGDEGEALLEVRQGRLGLVELLLGLGQVCPGLSRVDGEGELRGAIVRKGSRSLDGPSGPMHNLFQTIRKGGQLVSWGQLSLVHREAILGTGPIKWGWHSLAR